MTSPNDWLKQPLTGFKVVVNHGVTITPEWYDFPRRLGWRAKKHESILEMRGNQVVIDRVNGIIYCTPAMEERLRGAIPDCNFISV